MNVDLSGKIAVVTGGASGIGKAIISTLTEAGCEVYFTSRTANALDHGAWLLDMLEQQSVESLVQRIHQLERIDIFVNNAGISIPESIDQLSFQSFEETLKVNLIAPAMLLKEVARKMAIQGHGKIVSISSIAGIVAKKKASAYSSSKAGLAGLTRAIAVDMAQFGVLVNSVSPGPTETDMVEKLLSIEEKETLCNNIPLRRLANTSEIANVVLFLSSNLNTYITGQNIVVDGGFTIT